MTFRERPVKALTYIANKQSSRRDSKRPVFEVPCSILTGAFQSTCLSRSSKYSPSKEDGQEAHAVSHRPMCGPGWPCRHSDEPVAEVETTYDRSLVVARY